MDGGIYFLDADCYSRMTRVQMLWENPWPPVIAHHDFENAPIGVHPHTTAPMDWLIILLAVSLSPFTAAPLEPAGALISPLLGCLSLVTLWRWSWDWNPAGRWAMLLFFTVCPPLAHAFAVGRPDHQSLIVFLLTAALCAEWKLWKRETGPWAQLTGLAWGASLWVSLFEPGILFLGVLLLRSAFFRRKAWSGDFFHSSLITGAVLLVAIGVDGWRFEAPPPDMLPYFANWSRQIGELQSLPFLSRVWMYWYGGLFALLPLGALAFVWKNRTPAGGLFITLWVVVFFLTAWQIRWNAVFGVFSCLLAGLAFSLPRRWWITGIAAIFQFWPIAAEWDRSLYPSPADRARREEDAQEKILLRRVAYTLQAGPEGSFLAPWWLSPPLAYWSGRPGVAGSSHQSLPGTVDSSRFFLAPNSVSAVDILTRRSISYVIAYDADRIRAVSEGILGENAPQPSLGDVLWKAPRNAPSYLGLVDGNDFFRIYEVRHLPENQNAP